MVQLSPRELNFISDHLLPFIRLFINHPIYSNVQTFIENREKALFPIGMSLEQYRQFVLNTHRGTIARLGISLAEYNDEDSVEPPQTATLNVSLNAESGCNIVINQQVIFN